MTDARTQFAQAVALHQAGDLSAAEPVYRRVLEDVPHHLDALYLLGTLQLQRGRFSEAVELLSEVCRAQPEVAAGHNNLGIALKASGRFAEAARCFERAIGRDADYAEAHFNLGQWHEEQQNWAAAAEHFTRHVDLVPGDIETRVRLGYVLTQSGDDHCAGRVYEEIVQLRPEYAEIHANLSYVYERIGRLDEALAAAERCVQLRPDYAEGWNNLGIALRASHRLPEACAAFERATSAAGDFPLAQFNLATTQMLAGDLAGGWPGFEAREAIMSLPPQSYLQPRWQGELLAGKTLLVHADEGLGDTLQFVRFLPLARAASGAKIVLQCQRGLCELLRGVAGADEVIAEGDIVPLADAHVPLLSLPGLLQITRENLPREAAYIAIADGAGEWSDIVECGSYNVGIVWQGNPSQPRDFVRSCPLEQFRPLTEIAGARLISLQVGAAGWEQLADCPWRARLVDAGERLTDFAKTASLIGQLDLVITVDTSVAHLAGALGVNVWTLLCHTPDWRWELERGDSLWYPTMRLFRQPAWGDWPSVLQTVAAELTRVVDESARRP